MNRRIVVLSALRIKIMIYGSQNRIMSDQNIIPDKDSALILKMTAVIHKDIPAKMNIPSKVSIKRREHVSITRAFISSDRTGSSCELMNSTTSFMSIQTSPQHHQ